MPPANSTPRVEGCGPYTDLVKVPFGGDEYDTTLSTDLGSTTSYIVAVDQDTWISDAQPAINFGSDNRMHIRNDSGIVDRALLRFDLSAIPAKASILSARAWFYVDQAHPEGAIEIHRVTADWAEDSATWDSVGASIDAAVITGIPAQADGFVRVAADLTAQVQAWSNGEPNFGIALATVSDGVRAEYQTRENSNPPYLEVTVGTPPSSPG